MPEEREMRLMGRDCLYGRTERFVCDKSEGGKLLYNAPLCVLMGSVYIHLNDSGYFFNAKPTPKKTKQNRVDHGHV